MGLLRGRGGVDGTKYRMREKMFAIGDDFWIENDEGERAFKVDGKALRIRDTLVLEDASSGAELYNIQEKKLTIRDKIRIEFPGGGEATVRKAMMGIRDRVHVDVAGGDLKVHGNIVDHEYEIERDGDKIAEVSKRWLRVRDTYGVDVLDEADSVLVLSVTVAVDALAHD